MTKKTLLIALPIVLLLLSLIGFLSWKLIFNGQINSTQNISNQVSNKANDGQNPDDEIINSPAPTPNQLKEIVSNQSTQPKVLEENDREVDQILLEIKNGESATDPSLNQNK